MNRKLKLEELGRLNPDQYKAAKKWPIRLVLDDIRSMVNVGSAFRTADAFAVEELILGGITPTPPHREIFKTALGAELVVKWHKPNNLYQFLLEQQNMGSKIVCLEQAERTTKLNKFQWPNQQPLVIVVGNEVEGVNQQILNIADEVLEIPQYGTKHSLNVSVSLGILLWELIRERA